MKKLAIALIVLGLLCATVCTADALFYRAAPSQGETITAEAGEAANAGLLARAHHTLAGVRTPLLAAGILLALLGGYLWLVHSVRTIDHADESLRRKLRGRTRLLHDIGGWAIMAPGALLFVFFVWIPLFESLRLSFFDTKGFTTTAFVGLKNYRQMLVHPDFWPSLRNSMLYTFWSIIIGFFVPIIMSIIINEMTYGKNITRTGIYLPNIVPGLATVFLWRYIFSAEASGGMNMLLSMLGLPPMAYLSNTTIVIPIIVLTMTWRGAGATTLIYLASLQSINPEYYEAAIIDGAGVRQRIWHITMPNIFNLARTLLILQIIAVFQILYEPMVMTNGGPNNASVSMMQVVYRYAFERFDYSHAAAMSVIVSIILIALTLLYNKVSKPKDL